MSLPLISRSPDLKRLQNEGYDLEVRSGYLLVKDIPYVTSRRDIQRGTLVTKLVLAGDVTARPDDHVAYFAGEHPCRSDGSEIAQIKHGSDKRTLAEGVVVDHSFSAKPKPQEYYEDYHSKVSTYASILSGPAQLIDSAVSARTFPAIKAEEASRDTPFNYIDTASSRAEIDVITAKLKTLNRIAIVGLGGTGSYVLDLVAKTPVWQIHLYDGDSFLQHNAFRSPGAPSISELGARIPKATYFREIYGKMHSGVIDHPVYVTDDNVEELRGMDFVFVCVDSGESKKLIIDKLEEFDLPFIDVGMGIQVGEGSLGGIVRVTTSTPAKRDHLRSRVSFGRGSGNEYDRNIQIAELNAMNACLAVIKWKKLFGVYRDMKSEHHTQFSIDGNLLLNEDRGE